MIQCFLLKKKLLDYANNELSERDVPVLQRHLSACSRCRIAVEEIRLITTAAKDAAVPQVSEEFWQRFKGDLNRTLDQKAVTEISEKVVRPRFNLKPIVAVGLAASVLFFFTFLLTPLIQEYQLSRVGESSEALIDEILMIEDLTNDMVAQDLLDTDTSEMKLLVELEQQ